MSKTLSFLFLILLLVFSCAQRYSSKANKSKYEAEYEVVYEPTEFPKREFRGVWVATVANIDWPSKKGLGVDEQREEFTEIIDLLSRSGMNAVFVQVRAASDAFYAKSKEPWSEWLSGKQGIPPSPYYDPMEFMIDETHDKGLEFHAWLNLNRGNHKATTSLISDHLVKTRPQWFLTYDGIKLYNFGLPEVRQYITDLVINIVQEYDVDGIHFDDYFYPYKVAGQTLHDETAFRQYGGHFRNVDDWRRNNIDLLIKGIADAIAAEKPWVKFGVSPFGVWRNKSVDPNGSNTRGGQPSYDDLYADTRKWCRLGWVDYIVPQIYFPFEHRLVPYGVTTDWWAREHGRAHLYIGHGAYLVDGASRMHAWQDPRQLSRQIEHNRRSMEVSGSVYFSANAFIKNKLGLTHTLREHYKFPALPPAMSWKKPNTTVEASGLLAKKQGRQVILDWDHTNASGYVLYRFAKGEKINLADPSKILSVTQEINFVDGSISGRGSYVYVLTALDRLKNESEPIFAEI